MKASIVDILTLVNTLAELPAEKADQALQQYETERGASDSVRAIFSLADMYRKEKAGKA